MFKKQFIEMVMTANIALSCPAYALADCTILQKAGAETPFYQDGKCTKQESPCSTFKIAIAIMGYNGGILQDSEHPVWQFKKGYTDFLPVWRQEQTPKSWMQNSVIWYSQLITQKLGLGYITSELERFHYGNQDFSDKGGEQGLTRAWLNGVLKISPLEQVQFLSHVAQGEFLNEPKNFTYLKDLLKLDQTVDGWTVYGKTGSSGFNPNPPEGEPYRVGWFAGWLEKDGQKIAFTAFRQQIDKNGEAFTGLTVRAAFLQKLPSLLKTATNE